MFFLYTYTIYNTIAVYCSSIVPTTTTPPPIPIAVPFQLPPLLQYCCNTIAILAIVLGIAILAILLVLVLVSRNQSIGIAIVLSIAILLQYSILQ
jgi:hypothetical protein